MLEVGRNSERHLMVELEEWRNVEAVEVTSEIDAAAEIAIVADLSRTVMEVAVVSKSETDFAAGTEVVAVPEHSTRAAVRRKDWTVADTEAANIGFARRTGSWW